MLFRMPKIEYNGPINSHLFRCYDIKKDIPIGHTLQRHYAIILSFQSVGKLAYLFYNPYSIHENNYSLCIRSIAMVSTNNIIAIISSLFKCNMCLICLNKQIKKNSDTLLLYFTRLNYQCYYYQYYYYTYVYQSITVSRLVR